MMSGQWVAKSCGSETGHGQHFHVADGKKYACFGYTPINDK